MSFLESISAAQVPFIVWLQTLLHPGADSFFEGITYLGSFEWMILCWSFAILAISTSKGTRLFLLSLIASYLGALWLKEIFALTRPYLASAAVIGIHPSRGLSFPSGHSLAAMLIWGSLFIYFRNNLVRTLSVLLIFGVGLSRVYLGVHYPTDVLAGWAIGFVFLWAYLRWSSKLREFFLSQNKITQGSMILGLTALLFLPAWIWEMKSTPLEWILETALLFLSLSVGLFVHHHWINERPLKLPWRLARAAVGLLVLVPILKMAPYALATQIFVGLWLTVLVPLLFLRVKRAD